MKTTFKKSVLAFLTCVLALAFALTGCSGGGKDPKANFVGSWQYSGGTLDGEELTDEYMDMLEEWGVNCILILDEDGTGTLDLFLEVVDLKWEAKDATTATVTAEDESHDLKLKDDKLVLEVDGDKFIFTKSDKDLSGTVKKDRENAEKEEEIDEAVEDDDVQSIEISPAVTVADDDLCTITIREVQGRLGRHRLCRQHHQQERQGPDLLRSFRQDQRQRHHEGPLVLGSPDARHQRHRGIHVLERRA